MFARGGRIKIVASTVHQQPLRRKRAQTWAARDARARRRARTTRSRRRQRITGGRCKNGAAVSSIGVSLVHLNSVFSDNSAIGRGTNPALAGTPGGGTDGGMYFDGNDYRVVLGGTATRTTTPAKAAARSSSSATTGPAR